MTDANEPLASLQNALARLVEEAQAYERALPVNNYAARAVVAALMRLEAMCLTANLGLGMDEIRQTIAAALRLIIYQERLPNGQRKFLQMVELRGLENGRYILQPLMRYNAETATFEMTSAKPGWER